ncbi:MAG TPA: peroxiredoxin [bacterium]|nr:peroxiredoxin [bacterium]
MKKSKLVLFVFSLLFLFSCNQSKSEGFEVGQKAPQFSAQNQDGEIWNSSSLAGKMNMVVYFYPAAMTGGCTKQACSYRDISSELKKYDARVIGISGDNVENLKIFQQENRLNFTLLSDPQGKIATKFGVPINQGGEIERKVDGELVKLKRGSTINRWTFVIDKKGNIVYKDTSVNVLKDSENVIDVLKKLE